MASKKGKQKKKKECTRPLHMIEMIEGKYATPCQMNTSSEKLNFLRFYFVMALIYVYICIPQYIQMTLAHGIYSICV